MQNQKGKSEEKILGKSFRNRLKKVKIRTNIVNVHSNRVSRMCHDHKLRNKNNTGFWSVTTRL